MSVSDGELQHDVLQELEWEPSVDASRITVSIDQGVATLGGLVCSYGEKIEAEKVAKRVYGVKAVTSGIQVDLDRLPMRSDDDIARSAVNAIQWNTAIPRDRVAVTVKGGWVTIEGEVDWQYQRQAAESSLRNLVGVRGVANRISVRPRVMVTDVREKIEAALRRSAELDARRIEVEAAGASVILRGEVRSWAEREDAVHAAWSAPGVAKVEDHLLIKP